MMNLFPAVGAAVAIAGGDKLAGNRSYLRLFHHLGWTKSQMQTIAAVEVAGGLLMAPRSTRRLGGALVAAASTVMLATETQHGDAKLAVPRAVLLLLGLGAMLAPGHKDEDPAFRAM